jgi:hypothetical protein
VTVAGENGSVTIYVKGGFFEKSVIVSGGTFVGNGSSGTTAYTLKSDDPMVVEFVAPPKPIASPSSTYLFPTSIFYKPLPANPNLVSAAQSAAWQAEQSPGIFASFWITEDGSNVNDGSSPLYDLVASPLAMKVSCSAVSYAAYTCKQNAPTLNGSTIAVLPAGATRQGGSDHHISGGDAFNEYDFWLVSPVPTTPGGTLTVGGGGVCPKNGDGTACSGARATNVALTLGIVQAGELLACMQSTDPSCVLPHALAAFFRCNGPGFVPPANASDGQCFNPTTGVNQASSTVGIPEGTRGAIDATDAQINAMYPFKSYQAIIYRTMDRYHYGFVDTDSGWSGSSGIGFGVQSGQEFAFQGKRDPWEDVATLSGITWNGSGVQFPMGSWSPPLVFCAAGGC